MAPPVLPSLAILRQRAAIVRQMFRRRYLFNAATFATATSVPSHSSAPLIVTQRAVDQLRRIAASGEHLRICVDSGGCSGFEYKLMLDKRLDEREDEVINASEGATVVVDKLSLEFLRGSKLDFAEDLMRSAFRITDNPQATQGCSHRMNSHYFDYKI
uniref:FeS cluster biogenesis domain-containing protein n=1 Tax=Globodera rostochiensis TaxID=31243 RepID=A0A914HIV2_GLORO